MVIFFKTDKVIVGKQKKAEKSRKSKTGELVYDRVDEVPVLVRMNEKWVFGNNGLGYSMG